jgi:hypothetical protein
MSKKETRRAVRQAFPKAKTPPPSRSTYGQKSRPRPSGRGGPRGPLAPKPPSLKKAAVVGVIMGAIYFVVINFAWKVGNTTALGNLIIALIGCVIFMGVIYLTDRYKYQRYLNKKNPPK